MAWYCAGEAKVCQNPLNNSLRRRKDTRYYQSMAADVPESKPKQVDPGVLVNAALSDPNVPKIYTNGFGLGLTNADIIIVFQRFGPAPVAVVNLSYTLAKTLAQRLGSLVSEFENKIGGQEILTTDRIDVALTKKEPKGKDEVH